MYPSSFHSCNLSTASQLPKSRIYPEWNILTVSSKELDCTTLNSTRGTFYSGILLMSFQNLLVPTRERSPQLQSDLMASYFCKKISEHNGILDWAVQSGSACNPRLIWIIWLGCLWLFVRAEKYGAKNWASSEFQRCCCSGNIPTTHS